MCDAYGLLHGIGSLHPTISVPTRLRTFRSQARNAHEAHEEIRPTGFWRTSESVVYYLDRAGPQFYGLIWLRALASQVAAGRHGRWGARIACGELE